MIIGIILLVVILSGCTGSNYANEIEECKEKCSNIGSIQSQVNSGICYCWDSETASFIPY